MEIHGLLATLALYCYHRWCTGLILVPVDITYYLKSRTCYRKHAAILEHLHVFVYVYVCC